MRRGCTDLIRLRLQAVVTLAAMLLAGCAHHGSAFTPAEVADDGRALLYVYRPAQFSNAMLSPTVVIDGETVFDTHSGAYAVLSIAAGTHHLVLESEQRLAGNDELVVQFESGQVSYLRVDTALKFETGKPYTRHFSLVRVAERTALREIAQCRQQQSRLPSKYLWPVEQRDAHAEDVQTNEPATFTIDKSSNPFAVKRSHE
jgi:hypothetical protein